MRIKQPNHRRATTLGCAIRLHCVDLDAVRTFVAAADAGQFQEAAAALSITQQAVSKRIAALEKGLEVRLFTRTARADLATLVGERSRYLWPDSYDLRRIPVRDPAPVYPMSLIWREDNPHPALLKLRDYLEFRRADAPDTEVWLPPRDRTFA